MKENIDRSVWMNYFTEFTRRNKSRPTRLEVFGQLGAQEQEHGLLFEGIAMETASMSRDCSLSVLQARCFPH